MQRKVRNAIFQSFGNLVLNNIFVASFCRLLGELLKAKGYADHQCVEMLRKGELDIRSLLDLWIVSDSCCTLRLVLKEPG